MKKRYISPAITVCPLQTEQLLYVVSVAEADSDSDSKPTAKRYKMDYFDDEEETNSEDPYSGYVTKQKSLWDD